MTGLMLYKLFHYQVDFYRMFWYLSIWVVVRCILGFPLFRTYAHRLLENIVLKKIFELILNLSFGIYLVHILVMRGFLWNLSWIQYIENYYLQTIFVFVLTLLAFFAIVDIISFLPFSGYLIGYKSKK